MISLLFLNKTYFIYAQPKEIYTDPETNREVWRMTNNSGYDVQQYYSHSTISPNGKYLIFRTNRSPFIYIISTDGSNEQPFVSISGIDFSKNNLQGWFSNDGKKYYTYDGLYEVDIAKFLNNHPVSEYLRQISSTHGSGFYYPMVSPDGKSLYGVGNQNDVSSGGGIMKFINIDGSDYRQFTPPFYAADGGATGFDVTHGWLGNNHGWYINNNSSNYLSANLVFHVSDGSKAAGAAQLDVKDPTGQDVWYGRLAHMTLSPDAYFIGEGEGYVAGHGRNYKFSNTKYWTTDPVERQTTTLAPSQVANHYMFSPDGKWLATGDHMSSNKGLIMAYPVTANSSPVKIARYATASSASSLFVSSDPGFSPDGTKNVFSGDIKDSGNEDIYMAIFKKPDAPSNLNVSRSGDTVKLTWKPARFHREIKEYQIYRSTSQNGTYSHVASVPEVVTFLNAPSKINTTQTSITVDQTEGFPASGVIEILGLSTEKPTELVSYTSKTDTTFNGLTRGYNGTAPAEHYNDAFVWKHTGSDGYVDSTTTNYWYQVRAVEWSGLESDYSSAASTSTSSSPSPYPSPSTPSSTPPSPSPSASPTSCPPDINSDGIVDLADYAILSINFLINPIVNPQADINTDNIVDLSDYAILAKYFLKPCP